MRRKRSAAEITDLLERFRRSGLTRIAFCQQTGTALSTLGRYLNQRRKRPRLIQVSLEPAPEPGHGGFVLVLRNGRRIECGEAGLAQLIRAAEAVS